MTKERIELLKKYKPLFTTKNKYIIVTGGRGSGKSFQIAAFTVLLSYQKNEVILYTRFTMNSAHISIIPEFKKKIELFGLEADFYITKKEIINIRTGSKILFSGIKTSSGDQTANLKSIEGLTCWILDEAEELRSKDTFDKISFSIRQTAVQNRIIVVMNPCDEDHFIYQTFIDRIQSDVTYIHTTYLDNIENLSSSFIADADRLKSQNYNHYKHIFLGEWQKQKSGLIFKDWHTYKDEPKGHIVYGLDFGFSNDELALTQVIINDNGFYIKELLYSTGVTIPELTKFIKSKGILFKPIYCDHEPLIIEELFRAGINAQRAHKGRINEGLELMKSKPIFIHEDSLNLQKEFKSYVWQMDRNGNELPEPVDYLNHAIDSARYAITSHLQVPTVNATSFGIKTNKLKRATKLQ